VIVDSNIFEVLYLSDGNFIVEFRIHYIGVLRQ